VLLAAAGCNLTSSEPKSAYPPDDFALVVSRFEPVGAAPVETQRFEVDREGIALLRVSNKTRNASLLLSELPLFDEVACYRLRPESLRQLSRMLEASGLYRIASGVAGDHDAWRASGGLAIHWWGHGRNGSVVAADKLPVEVGAAVHVVHAFLPAGYGFALPSLVGEDLPARLLGVPAPCRDLEGALRFHRELLAQRPQDRELVLHVFVLALEAGERELARSLVARLRELMSDSPDDRALLERCARAAQQ
jgi:hypothetical protein